MTDVAKRAKVDLLITCGEGDCGSCEIEQMFLDGEKRIVRPCCIPVVEPEAGADDTVTFLTYPDFQC